MISAKFGEQRTDMLDTKKLFYRSCFCRGKFALKRNYSSSAGITTTLRRRIWQDWTKEQDMACRHGSNLRANFIDWTSLEVLRHPMPLRDRIQIGLAVKLLHWSDRIYQKQMRISDASSSEQWSPWCSWLLMCLQETENLIRAWLMAGTLRIDCVTVWLSSTEPPFSCAWLSVSTKQKRNQRGQVCFCVLPDNLSVFMA